MQRTQRNKGRDMENVTAHTLAAVLKGQQIIDTARGESFDVYTLANGCLVVDWFADAEPAVQIYGCVADFKAGVPCETFRPDER